MIEKRLLERKEDYFRALDRLESALNIQTENNDILIDAIIQRFEFTFEQSWKLMKLYLEFQGIQDEALAPRSTIRCAFKNKVIEDGDVWIEMLVDRNRTSHIYDETTAQEVVENVRQKYINQLQKLRKNFESIL